MASSRPWPFDDEDRPSGSVRPLSQADLQTILAHLGDDPDRAAGRLRRRIGRWWRCGCGPAWASRAAPPRPAGGGLGRPSGPPGPEPCPGGSPPSSGWVPLADSLAACWPPGWAWSSVGWRPWWPAGGCGSSPAQTPSPGGEGRRGSDAPPGCSSRWSGRGRPHRGVGGRVLAAPAAATWRRCPTATLRGLRGQTAALAEGLHGLDGLGRVPVRALLCVHGPWPASPRSFPGRLQVAGPRQLAKLIRSEPPLAADQLQQATTGALHLLRPAT